MRRLVMVAMILGLLACDEVDVRFDDRSRPVTIQQGAARVLFPAEGIARLYDLDSAEGFALSAERENAWTGSNAGIAFGPLDQSLTVTARSSMIESSEVVLTTRLRDVSVAIPVRVSRGADLRICRFSVVTDAIDVIGRLRLVVEDGANRLEVVSTPTVQVDRADIFVEALGSCSIPEEADFGDDTFDDVLVDYALAAIAESARETLTTSPLELGGIVTGRVEMDRRAPFENRRGTLAIETQLAPTAGLALSERGIDVALDVGVAATRASCAPPVELQPAEEVSTELIDPQTTREFGADLAMGIAIGSFERLARSMVLGGFACRGLEDARPAETNEELLPTEDLRLEDIGLGAIELGPWMRVTSAPGSLPDLTARSENGVIELRWQSLTLELYGEYQGAPARVASLEAGATATLRARRNTPGLLRFDVDAITVDTVSLESPWLLRPLDQASLRQWARRALLLILSEQFVLPLPLMAPSDVRVVGTEVRDNDVVLYLSYD